MPHLTLENLPDLPLKAYAVPLPELGDGMEAYVAELSADEHDERIDVAWDEHKQASGQESNAGFRAWVAAACWCGPDRTLVAQTADDIATVAERLSPLGSRVVSRLATKAADINGVGDAEKNSPPNSGANGTPS